MNEWQQALETELNRLLALGLTPEEQEIARRYYSQKERESMDESAFCGPHRSFPVTSQADVSNAAHLIGHAENPDAVKRCIIGKAKSHGWTLPASWESEKETSDNPELMRTDVEVDADGNHAETTGSHSHHHNAYGSQAGDQGHKHSHSHKSDNNHKHSHASVEKADTPEIIRADVEVDDDGNHDKMTGTHTHKHKSYGQRADGAMHSHSHGHQDDNDHSPSKAHGHTATDDEYSATPDIIRTMPSETTIFAPITRIDQAKREVVLTATAEDLDSYKTVITFDGSKDAFKRWRGNIREMHDHTKAVGRALKIEPNEDQKNIDITLRVSRGAEDTWQKVLDGTLSGASIGARNGKWENRTWKGETVPHLVSYDLVEVSLVDNPSCPGCDVKLVRMDGANLETTDILDNTEDTPANPSPHVSETIDRRGARVATNTMASMHRARDHAFDSIREMLSNCSCDQCATALRILDPDNDGDIDILSTTDTDHDSMNLGAAAGDGSGIMKFVETEITRQLAPSLQRMSGIAARMSAVPVPSSEELTRLLQNHTQEIIQKPDPDMTRRMESIEQKLAELDEVRSAVAEVKGLVERIGAQPQAGGPIVNSSVVRNAGAEQYGSQPDMTVLEAEIIQRLSRSGILTHDQQVNAALYLQGQASRAARR